jgi:hypothetical protein
MQREKQDNLCASVCICDSSHYPNLVLCKEGRDDNVLR